MWSYLYFVEKKFVESLKNFIRIQRSLFVDYYKSMFEVLKKNSVLTLNHAILRICQLWKYSYDTLLISQNKNKNFFAVLLNPHVWNIFLSS